MTLAPTGTALLRRQSTNGANHVQLPNLLPRLPARAGAGMDRR